MSFSFLIQHSWAVEVSSNLRSRLNSLNASAVSGDIFLLFSLLDFLFLWGQNGRLRGSNILTDLNNPLHTYLTCSISVSLLNWIRVNFFNFTQKCVLLNVFFSLCSKLYEMRKNTHIVFSFSLSVSQMFRFSGVPLQKFLFLDGNRELEIRGKLHSCICVSYWLSSSDAAIIVMWLLLFVVAVFMLYVYVMMGISRKLQLLPSVSWKGW